MGKVSVSWHADSSLEDYSSIGVYHCLPTQKATKWDWRIALRPIPPPSSGVGDNGKPTSSDASSSSPPVVVPTKDGDAYFLFGTFNHTHQHCVLAGTVSNRISSTHRVAVTKEDTYEYIARRVRHASKVFQLQIEGKKKPSLWNPTKLNDCQKALTEVEMDWIAQYWLQGSQHDVMHVWWQRPMKALEAQWVKLEVCSLCLNGASRVVLSLQRLHSLNFCCHFVSPTLYANCTRNGPIEFTNCVWRIQPELFLEMSFMDY
jgi:mRNA N6-methyladenine demethylase